MYLGWRYIAIFNCVQYNVFIVIKNQHFGYKKYIANILMMMMMTMKKMIMMMMITTTIIIIIIAWRKDRLLQEKLVNLTFLRNVFILMKD
jgi:hypothetical protein